MVQSSVCIVLIVHFVIGHFDLQRKSVRARWFNHPCVLCSLSFCYLFVIGLLFHFDLQSRYVMFQSCSCTVLIVLTTMLFSFVWVMSLTSIYNEGSKCQNFQTSSCVPCS